MPHDRACDTSRVNSPEELCVELASTWREEIPLAAAMQIEVASFAAGELIVRAPLAPNTNVHGTAFAGSLFSTCVLAGWGRVWLAARNLGLEARIVVADSRIEYRKGVTGEIVCRCAFDERARSAELDALATSGRAAFALVCTVDGADAPAVTFAGKYVVVLKRK